MQRAKAEVASQMRTKLTRLPSVGVWRAGKGGCLVSGFAFALVAPASCDGGGVGGALRAVIETWALRR